MYNEKYMKMAMEEAKKALKYDEVPIGAVIVRDEEVIAKAFNQKNTMNIVTKHAEILAIEEANRTLNNWRLAGCDIYITLEPCPMCMAAIQQARISNVYYGIENSDKANRNIIELISKSSNTNPQVFIYGGFMEESISLLLTSFFKNKRKK